MWVRCRSRLARLHLERPVCCHLCFGRTGGAGDLGLLLGSSSVQLSGKSELLTLLKRDAEAIARLQKLRFYPLAVVGGDGCYLIGEDGRRLLDFSASWGAVSLGHSHPAIREAASRALESQAGASILSFINEPAVELAEKLLELTPGDSDRRVWLGHSGSDANETAARAVTAATGRPRIISFEGAYHGGTSGSMAISGHSAQEGVEKAPGLVSLPYPDPYRPHEGDPTGRSVIALLERRLSEDVEPGKVAALFLEPIQSDGGLIVTPAGFLKELADLCRSDILMVCDEVKVGLGRSGLMHCFQHEGTPTN
ncbi:MAG: aminotransferase class III-fold pyridoxal phosphate-dependent enzyme [Acidimicrobiia bacterium]|nr:aminotransferase class III-fold pyridoxal phosphate-dependent enzyme [Acidimicrobiia bacterium]